MMHLPELSFEEKVKREIKMINYVKKMERLAT